MKSFKLIVTLILFFTMQALSQQFPNIAVTTNNKDQSEPTIAISPVNSDHLLAAWNDFRVINANTHYKPGYAFSTDGVKIGAIPL
jgi:hypothetical protein